MELKADYPWLCVEESKENKYFGFEVVRGQADFITSGRVANSETFRIGCVFTGTGRYLTYRGSAGWPRFHPRVCILLDNLVLPGLLTKAAAVFFYFGPMLQGQEKLSVEEFRQSIIDSIEGYRGRTERQLRRVLAKRDSYRDIIEGVEWWQYHGGVRDSDGHQEDSADYNP